MAPVPRETVSVGPGALRSVAPDSDVVWLDKDVFARKAGVSLKQAERLARQHDIRAAHWKDAEGGPVRARYHAGDVERFLAERQRGAPVKVLPAGEALAVAPSNGHGHLPAHPSPVVEEFIALLTPILRAITSGASGASMSGASGACAPVVRPGHEFLTVKEAAAEIRMTQGWVRWRIRTGAVPAERAQGDHGPLRIRRRDLELL